MHIFATSNSGDNFYLFDDIIFFNDDTFTLADGKTVNSKLVAETSGG